MKHTLIGRTEYGVTFPGPKGRGFCRTYALTADVCQKQRGCVRGQGRVPPKTWLTSLGRRL